MMKNPFENPTPHIEKIQSPENGEAAFFPERGGIITSLKLKGKEILYMEDETLFNPDVNVKGGIPVLFPNAGPLSENSLFPKLPQHGFARNAKWQSEVVGDGFKETLRATEASLEQYPYDFDFSLMGSFNKTGSFSLKQEVLNKESEKELPLSMGFHPYFVLPGEGDSAVKKAKIRFDFPGGELAEAQIEKWANGKPISIDNPRVTDPNCDMTITIPDLGRLTINASPEYQKIWIWSLPDKDFVCIEPVMRNKDGLVNDPLLVKPGETFSAVIEFSLED